ncbi:tetratricopeptide repeat protein [Scytonema hofmannii FACHB-248]|uniref:Tetratricopeptide repeat protein n=1 Tax=Scytonema hofmannii FACHB-248 TaxID=1842502 RepID=A0ABR8GUL1_9CYAN|nr:MULTISPECIES: CHAT domain-containing tetratricopeptide repeat protein [Nostocales]MBD2607053.1 tetratricopeptide repeat protein [Scytonema hofmannii FACHB-248]
MFYRLKSLTLATLVFSLILPIGAAESRTGEIVQVPRTAQTQTTQQRRDEAIRLNKVGLQQLEKGQFREALETFQQSLAIVKQINDKAGEGTTLNNIGLVYNNLGEYPKALEFYQQSLVIHKQINDKAGEGTTLTNIGGVYDNLGQYPKALEFYQLSLVIRKEIGDKAGEGTILNNIGAVYNNLGQYPKALEFYQQSLVIRKEISDKATEGITLNNIGEVYRNLGQYPKALEFYQQSLVISKQIGDKATEGRTLNNIGAVYISLGQYPKALEFYQQSLVISKQIGDKAQEGRTLNNIGAVYRNLGQYPKALEFYQQSLVISKQIGDKAQEGRTLNNIGAVYRNLGQYPKALEFYQQSLVIRKQIGDKAGEGRTLNNIGAVYISLGQYPKAETTLLDAIKVWESLRVDLKDADKISIFEQQTFTYRFLQIALIAQNKNDKALEVSERGRARAFVELLASKQSPNFNNQINIKPPSIEQIKQIAKQQNATFVEYSIIESQLYIWVVKPTGEIAFKQVDLKSLNTPLKDLVDKSRLSIGAGGRGINVEPTGKPVQKENFQKLYQVLIEPIASLLPSNPDAHVIFIPHESLFLVPFVALQDKDGKYLIEKHTILTSPAIQVLELTHQQRQKTRGKDVLVMGNPTMPSVGVPPVQLRQLEYAEMEAKEIAKLENTTAIIGSNATKAAFKQKLPSARIIHLATHGLLDDADKSIPNAIALAPSGNDDGLLTPAEIINLQINAELVVLSACDTGRGKITGDGVVGLSRSLITAGASSVIVSLWSIPDSSTSELMSDFYGRLQQNPDKAVALRQAMLNTMKKHSSPIYWAAFTLIGETK